LSLFQAHAVLLENVLVLDGVELKTHGLYIGYTKASHLVRW
jgi:hypothetical protein